MEKHRNSDGTYNGAAVFAELTGLSEAEIKWIMARTKELIATGLPKEERLAIIKGEAKGKPWLV
jgi:hypothetical protein